MCPSSRDDFDKVWEWEARDEQARFDEAQDEAANARANAFEREHGEDVP